MLTLCHHHHFNTLHFPHDGEWRNTTPPHHPERKGERGNVEEPPTDGTIILLSSWTGNRIPVPLPSLSLYDSKGNLIQTNHVLRTGKKETHHQITTYPIFHAFSQQHDLLSHPYKQWGFLSETKILHQVSPEKVELVYTHSQGWFPARRAPEN